MTKKNQKRLLFLCGYATFSFLVMALGMRILARIAEAFGLLTFGAGEVLSNILASLLPSPF